MKIDEAGSERPMTPALLIHCGPDWLKAQESLIIVSFYNTGPNPTTNLHVDLFPLYHTLVHQSDCYEKLTNSHLQFTFCLKFMMQQQKNLVFSSPQTSCHKSASDTERPDWDSQVQGDWSNKTWTATDYMKKRRTQSQIQVFPGLHSLEILSANNSTTRWPKISTEELGHK